MINKFAFKPNLLFMIVFCLNVEFAPAQIIEVTPEQRFFDWTKLQFDREIYQNRRVSQIKLLRASGGGILLIRSHQGVSNGTTFRQLSDFLYFTGLELPYSILAIDSDEGKTTLFTPGRDVRFESASRSNDFPGRPLGNDPDLSKTSGIANVKSFDEFENTLEKWIEQGQIVRINFSKVFSNSSSDFLYFTGLELPYSILAIDSDEGKTTLFTPGRDVRFESASRSNDFPGRPLGNDPDLSKTSGIANVKSFDEFENTLEKWIEQGQIVRINLGRSGAIHAIKTDFIYDWSPNEAFAYHLKTTFPSIKMKNAFIQIAKMRMVKSPEEIEVIRRVCNLTILAIKETARFVKDGIDERGLEAELEAVYKRGGAQRLAFSSIIKSGPNSLWPWRILAAHYERRNRTMKTGELVIFDVRRKCVW